MSITGVSVFVSHRLMVENQRSLSTSKQNYHFVFTFKIERKYYYTIVCFYLPQVVLVLWNNSFNLYCYMYRRQRGISLSWCCQTWVKQGNSGRHGTLLIKLVTPHPPIGAALCLVLPVLTSEKTTSHKTFEHIYCCCCYTDILYNVYCMYVFILSWYHHHSMVSRRVYVQ